MTKMPRDLWKRIVDSGFVAIVTVLSFLSFFVWWLLTSESDVKSHQKVQIGCFTSPSIRGISEKQSFLVYFQLGIISYKKKKKRYWAYVDVVLIITSQSWRPALSVLTAQSHMYDGGRALPQCCFNDGPHFQRSGDVETVLFQCITLITFEILDQTSPNFQGSRRNGCEWCVQNYMWNGWHLTKISMKNAPPTLSQRWLSALQ